MNLFSIVFHIIIMVTSHHQHIFIELLFMLRLMINALTIRYVCSSYQSTVYIYEVQMKS